MSDPNLALRGGGRPGVRPLFTAMSLAVLAAQAAEEAARDTSETRATREGAGRIADRIQQDAERLVSLVQHAR